MKVRFSGTGRVIQPRETLRRRVTSALEAAGASGVRCAITERSGILEAYGDAQASESEGARTALAPVLRNLVVEAA